MAETNPKRVFDFYPLEERVLLSGEDLNGEIEPAAVDSPAIAALAAIGDAEGAFAEDSNNVALLVEQKNTSSDSDNQDHEFTDDSLAQEVHLDPLRPIELVFVDAAVEDSQILIDGLRDTGTESTQWVVVRLESERDGVEQITETLQRYSGVDAIHLLSHGDESGIAIGNTRLDNDSLAGYAGDLASWSGALDPDADLLIYGCDLASSDSGQNLIESIASLCDCDVAASDDLTGHESLGGDWSLEHSVGDIQTDVAFAYFAQTSWESTLDATNNSPTNVVPGSQTTDEDVPLVFESASSNSIQINDDPGDSLTVEISVSYGTISLSQTTNLTFESGANGESNFIVTGVISDLNAALEGLRYESQADFYGSDTLTIKTTDGVTYAFNVDASAEGHYEFNAAGLATDSSASGVDGTLVGDASSSTDATRGEVLSLDGDGDAVEFNSLFGSQQSLTLSAWVNLSNADTGGSDLFNVGNRVIVRLDDSTAGGNVVGTYYDGTTFRTTNSNVSVEGSGWHLITYTIDSGTGTQTIYIDELAAGTTSYSQSISYSGASNSAIGYNPSSSLYDLDGMVDEARVFSRALSASEVAALACVPVNPYDTDTVDITINPVNDSPFAIDELLDGSNDYETDRDVSLSVSAAQGVLSNDADVDGDSLNATVLTGPSNALYFNLNLDGSFDYTPAANFAGTDFFTYTVSDGNGGTDTATAQIRVIAVNRDPVVTISSSSLSFIEDAGDIFLDAAATVSDPDLLDFDSGVLTVSVSAGGSANDELIIVDEGTGPGQVNVLGGDVRIGTQVVGTVAGGTGASDPLTVTWNSNADQSDIESVLQRVAFRNQSENPSETTRTISVTLTDGDGGTSVTQTRDVSVTAVNDAPVGTAPASVSVFEDTLSPLTGFSVMDLDADNATIGTELSAVSGTLNVTLSGSATIDSGGNGTGYIGLSGTVADINATLLTLQYTGATDLSGIGADTITMTVRDNGNTGIGGAAQDSDVVQVDITAVNDAPVVNAPASTLNATEQTSLNIHGTGFSFSDVDVSSGNVTAIMSVTQGTLTVSAGTTGTSIDLGNGSSSVTVSGDVSQVNALLSGANSGTIVYFNASDDPDPSVAISLRVNDQGNNGQDPGLTGDGSSEEGIASQNILIAGVNDEQSLDVNATLAINENDTQPISSAHLSTSDSDNSPNQIVYRLDSVPTRGNLELSGSPLSLSQTFTQQDIDLGRLEYAHGGTEFTSDSFDFTVDDGAGTSTSNTFLISISIVNDAPTITAPATASTDEDTTLTFESPGVGVIDLFDEEFDPITVSISVNDGALTLAGITGLTIIDGDGSDGTLSFTGAETDVDAALDGLQYAPTIGFNGTANLSVLADDGSTSSSFNIAITVNPVTTVFVWDGGGTTDDWSDALNWDLDRVPRADDVVVFDATSVKDSTVDSAFAGAVTQVQVNAEYTGTITQATDLQINDVATYSGGSWSTAGNQLDIFGDWTIDGTSLDVSGSDVYVHDNLSQTSTLSASGSTWWFSGSSPQMISTNDAIGSVQINSSSTILLADDLTYEGDFVYTSGSIVFSGSEITLIGSGSQTINSGALAFDDFRFNTSGTVNIVGQMDVNGTLSIDQIGSINGGDLMAGGDVIVTDPTMTGTGTIVLDGTGNQSVSAGGGEGGISNLETNKSSGTATLIDQLNVAGNLTLTQGNVDASGLTLSLVSVSSGTVDGSIGPIGAFHMDALGTKAINGVLDVLGSTTLDSVATLNGGTVRAMGDLFTRDLTYGGTATLELSGSANQSISTNGGSGILHNLTINKSGGVATATEDLNLTGTVRHTSGNLDVSSVTTRFLSSGLVIDASGMAFGDVEFTGFVSADVVGDLDIDGDLLFDSVFVINNGTIVVSGDIQSNDTTVLGSTQIRLDGSANQVISGDDLTNGNIEIAKSGGVVRLADDLVLDGAVQDVVITSGTLDLSGVQVDLNGAVRVVGGTLTGDGNVQGDLLVQNLGRVGLDVNSLTPGDHQQIDVTGAVTLGSDAILQLDITGISGGGQIDDLLTFSTRTGTWASVNLNGDSVGFTPFDTYDDAGGDLGVYLNTGPSGSIGDVTVNEDATDTVIDLASAITDAEHNATQLTFSIESNTNAALFTSVTIDNTTDTLTLDYAPDQSGVADVTVRATDPFGMFVDVVFRVTVNAIDDAPVVSINPIVVDEGNAFTLTTSELQATDPDNTDSELIYSVTGTPGCGTITLSGSPTNSFTHADVVAGLVQYVHDDSEGNSDSFTLSLTDGVNVVSPIAISVNINSVNDNAPVIQSDGGGAAATISVNEHSSAVTTVVATDTDLPSQSLTYSLQAGGDSGVFQLDSGSGVLTFASAPDAEIPLDSNGDNVYQLAVVVSDGILTDTQAIDVIVNDINEFSISVISDVDASANAIDENAALGTAVGITASAIDGDATNSAITYSLDDDDGGRFDIDSNSGVVSFAATIDYDVDGPTRNIVVRATSADGSSTTLPFSVAINNLVEAPVAVNDDLTVQAGGSLSLSAPGILSNDSDGDGDPLSAILVSSTSNGTLSLGPDGSIVYTPTAGFVGIDTFRYQVSDGTLLSNIAEVRINVTVAGLPSTGGTSGSGSDGNDGDGDSGNDGEDSGADGDTANDPIDSGDESGSGDSGGDGEEQTKTKNESSGEESSSSSTESQGNAAAVTAPPPQKESSESEDEEQGELTGDLVNLLPGVGGKSSGFASGVYQGALTSTSISSMNLGSGLIQLTEIEEMMRMEFQQAIAWDLWEDSETVLDESPIEFLVGSAGAAAGLFSIGYVMWALRGGAFVTVMASSMPAWRIVDPAALLSAYRGSQMASDGLDEMVG